MIPLTLLYAPGDRIELVEKALDGPADVVIIDLEDAVAPARKEGARAVVAALLARRSVRAVQVRVNAPGTPWHAADLARVCELPPWVAVRVPKVESPRDVEAVRAAAGERDVHALLETPLAVERALEIADSGVASVGLGESDLRSALGVATTDHLGWQRQRVVNAAAAAGLNPPAMSVFPHLADEEGLAASCALGRAMGFIGRTAIHPKQLEVIRRSFLPSEEEVSRARAVLAGFEGAQEAGSGTFLLPDGGFVDVAMVRAAERVVDLSASTAPHPSQHDGRT